MYTQLYIHDRFLRSNKESFLRVLIWLIFIMGILISTYAFETVEQSYLMTIEPHFYIQSCYLWYVLVSQVMILSLWIGGLAKESTMYDVYLIKPTRSSKWVQWCRFMYLIIMTLKWSLLLSLSYVSVLFFAGSFGWIVSIDWMHFAYHTLTCTSLGCIVGFVSRVISNRIGYLLLLAWLGFWMFSFYNPSSLFVNIQEVIAIPSWHITHYAYDYSFEHYVPFGILVVLLHLIFLNLYSSN